MAVLGAKFLSLRPAAILFFIFMLASVFISAERSINHEASRLGEAEELEPNYLVKIISFLWQSDESGHQHVWPVTQKLDFVSIKYVDWFLMYYFE